MAQWRVVHSLISSCQLFKGNAVNKGVYGLIFHLKHGRDLVVSWLTINKRTLCMKIFIVVSSVSLKKNKEHKYPAIKVATFV